MSKNRKSTVNTAIKSRFAKDNQTIMYESMNAIPGLKVYSWNTVTDFSIQLTRQKIADGNEEQKYH